MKNAVMLCLLLILPATPLSTYGTDSVMDTEMIDCCIKPCSCLPPESRKPSCRQMRADECKRLGGEKVADCMMCY
jgi:hypothetical protein